VEKVVVGVLGTTSDVLFYLAEDNGYFEHLRIEPVFERFDSGGRMVTSLATNQIEVGGGSPSVGLYNAIARGVNVKMVADRASGSPGYIVFVRKDLADTIRDFPDLRGRRIAIAARGTTAEIVVGRALERAGLTMDDVDLVEMPYPDMVAALATDAIDIGVSPEPSPSIAVQRGVAVKWRTGYQIMGNQQGSTIMYTGQFIEQRPNVARDFMVGYLLGARDYTDAFEKRIPDKLAQARNTVLQRTDLRDPELLDRLENSRIDPNGQLDRAALASDYEWFRQHAGLVESVNLNDVVDSSFADYAVSVLGQYR
jgi:NitT/TauT family transport system substrate-binding protein